MTQVVKKSPVSTKIVLARARLLFVLLLIVVLSSVSSSLILGWQSGELQSKIISPIKQNITSIIEELISNEETEKKATPSGSWKKYVNTTPTQQPKRIIRQPQRIIISQPQYQTSGTSYEEALRQMNERAAQKKAEQDAWWTQKQQEFNAFGQQSQQNMQDFQRQAQQNMEQFEKKNQQKVDEFKKQNGF